MTKYKNFFGSGSLRLLLARGSFQHLDRSVVREGPLGLPAELPFSSAKEQRSDIRPYEMLRNVPMHILTYTCRRFSSIIFAG